MDQTANCHSIFVIVNRLNNGMREINVEVIDDTAGAWEGLGQWHCIDLDIRNIILSFLYIPPWGF